MPDLERKYPDASHVRGLVYAMLRELRGSRYSDESNSLYFYVQPRPVTALADHITWEIHTPLLKRLDPE